MTGKVLPGEPFTLGSSIPAPPLPDPGAWIRDAELTRRAGGQRRLAVACIGPLVPELLSAVMQDWQHTRSGSKRLCLVCFSPTAPEPDDVRRRIGTEGEALLELARNWPSPVRGAHRVPLASAPDIILTVVFGDALEFISRMAFSADVLYALPGAGGGAVEAALERLAPGGCLIANPGYESIARRRALLPADSKHASTPQRWRDQRTPAPERSISSAVIIGGGLAGAACAASFAQRGVRVTLVERARGIAAEASGNPAGVLMPYIKAQPDARMRFSVAAFEHARRHCAGNRTASGWDECGVVQLAVKRRVERATVSGVPVPPGFALPVSADEISELAGVRLLRGGLFFPGGGIASPPAVCRGMLDHPLIETRLNTSALCVEEDASGARVLSKGRIIAEADVAVIAAAHEAPALAGAPYLPLGRVRGQLTFLPPHPALRNLRIAVCYDGYATPERNGMHVVGASFERGNESPAIDPATNREILRRFAAYIPDFDVPMDAENLPGRVAWRVTTPDRFPVAGFLPDADAFARGYQTAAWNDQRFTLREPWWRRRTLICTGFGSHGLLAAPLCGELIADLALGDPVALDEELRDALSPLRFLVRELNRK